MHFLTKNINHAFALVVRAFHEGTMGGSPLPLRKATSRYGDVIVLDEPAVITYQQPLERVLLNRNRDCNPFFHLYESLWMLAGRNDVAPLSFYNSKIAEIASDDGETFNGAYGYRWRHARGTQQQLTDEQCRAWNVPKGTRVDDAFKRVDQLKVIIDEFKARPDSRRVVLQMWNVEDDLLKIAPDVSKDVCCNTAIYFLLRPNPSDGPDFLLDMTVTNRSNDLVWGAFGANVVHMSFLQEYLAAHIGAGIGVYHQMTNNLHVYQARWEPEKLLEEYQPHDFCPNCFQGEKTMRDTVTNGKCEQCGKPSNRLRSAPWIDEYKNPKWNLVPLVDDPKTFDEELPKFVELFKDDSKLDGNDEWEEGFFSNVASPMLHAFVMNKQKNDEAALTWASKIVADDWRLAATEWIQRRIDKRKAGYDAGAATSS